MYLLAVKNKWVGCLDFRYSSPYLRPVFLSKPFHAYVMLKLNCFVKRVFVTFSICIKLTYFFLWKCDTKIHLLDLPKIFRSLFSKIRCSFTLHLPTWKSIDVCGCSLLRPFWSFQIHLQYCDYRKSLTNHLLFHLTILNLNS